MKSKITIDMDWDNQPIILIEYEESPDVRDKMVKRFMETFGGESYFATFHFKQDNLDPNFKFNRKAVVRPIEPQKLQEHLPILNDIVNGTTKQTAI